VVGTASFVEYYPKCTHDMTQITVALSVGTIIAVLLGLMAALIYRQFRVVPELAVRGHRVHATPIAWMQRVENAPEEDREILAPAGWATPFQWQASRHVRAEMGGAYLSDTKSNRLVAAQKVLTYLSQVEGMRKIDIPHHHTMICVLVFIPGTIEVVARSMEASVDASVRRIKMRNEHRWGGNPFTWLWQSVLTDPQPGEGK